MKTDCACQVQWDEEKSSRLWAILSDPESQGNIDCTFQPHETLWDD